MYRIQATCACGPILSLVWTRLHIVQNDKMNEFDSLASAIVVFEDMFSSALDRTIFCSDMMHVWPACPPRPGLCVFSRRGRGLCVFGGLYVDM